MFDLLQAQMVVWNLKYCLFLTELSLIRRFFKKETPETKEMM